MRIKKPSVIVLILTWNGKKWIKRCLDSLLKSEYPNFKILVVDNGSTDGSLELIKSEFSSIKIVKNKKNTGYARGNNKGINIILNNYPETKYIVLLNQDVEVDLKWLQELVNVAKNDSTVGIVGSTILSLKNRKEILHTGGILSKDAKATHHEDEIKNQRSCAWVTFAGVLILKQTFLKIGLLDEQYGSYCEDVDFCLRAKKAKLKVICTKNALMWHEQGGSLGASYKRLYIIRRNGIRLLVKFFPFTTIAKRFTKEIKEAILFLFFSRGKLSMDYQTSPRVINRLKRISLYIFSWGWNIINLPRTLISRLGNYR